MHRAYHISAGHARVLGLIPDHLPRLDDTMQKATAYDIPMAVGVARDLGALPKQRTTTFYAWEPDTSFFELQPKSITFPPNDLNAHLCLGPLG